jgi:hypothetical protein
VEIGFSVNQVPIRLKEERWHHIVNSHDDLAGYYDDCLHVIEEPDMVLTGTRGSLKAVKKINRRDIVWRR